MERIQELLGHSDLSVYTHVLSSSAAGTQSPLENLPGLPSSVPQDVRVTSRDKPT